MGITKAMAVAVMTISAFAPALSQGPAGGGVEQEILQLEREWNEANERGDAPTMRRLSADDIVHFNNDVSKPEFGKGHDGPNQNLTGRKITLEHQTVRVFGDTAVAVARATIVDEHDVHLPRFTVEFMHVWARRNGKWQVVADMFYLIDPSRTPPEPAAPSK
jgi:ketosteroid isomerase-like protein